MKLFVAALPYDFDDVDLKEMFELYGEVNSAKVVLDKETGKSRGFGFVEMPNSEEGKYAIETLKDISLGKRPLIVKEAEERSKPPGNRPYRGGYDKGNDNRNRSY